MSTGCECGLCSASRGDPTLEHIGALAQQLDDGDRAVLLLMAEQLFRDGHAQHVVAAGDADEFSHEAPQLTAATEVFRQAARTNGSGEGPKRRGSIVQAGANHAAASR